MATKPKIPDIPQAEASDRTQLQRFIEAVREIIQTREGVRGDYLDKAVTFRDLVDLSLASRRPGGSFYGTGGSGGSGPAGPPGPQGPPGEEYIPDYTAPPSPANLRGTSLFKGVIIEWDTPTYTVGHGNAYTEVFVAQYGGTGPLPTFAAAVAAGKAAGLGTIYVHPAAMGAQLHIWAKHVTNDDVASASPAGGTNGVQVTIGRVGNADLGDLIITADKLAAGSVTNAKMAANAIGLPNFAAGIEPVTIVTGSIVPTTKTTETIYLVGQSKIFRWDGTAYVATVPSTDISGTLADAQIADLAATKITGQLTDAQLADLAATKITGQLTDAQIADIATSKLTGEITSTQITDGAISTPKLAAGSVTTAALAADSVTAAQIAAGAVTASEIAAGAVTTAKLAAGAVTANEIAANAITAGAIAAGAVTAGKIAAGAIVAGDIAAGAVTTAKLAAGAVTANEIAANAITAGKVAAGAIGADQILANAIVAGKIAAGAIAVGSAAIANGAIRNALIENLAVDSAKIADGAIGTVKIADAAIVTAKIGDAQITNAKIVSLDATKITAGFIDAARIQAGSIDATKINSNGLEVRSAAGVVLLSSGVPLAEANASAGLRNSNVGATGGNLLRNPGWRNGSIDGWSTVGSLLTGQLLPSYGVYRFAGTDGAFLYVAGAYVSDTGYLECHPGPQRVGPGKSYQFSMLVNLHRAGVQLYGYFLDAAGAFISAAGYSGYPGGAYSSLPANGTRTDTYAVGNSITSGSGENEANYVRIFFTTVAAPAGAATFLPVLRVFQAPVVGENYCFMARAMFSEVPAGTAVAVTYDSGAGIFAGAQRISPATASTYIENAAIGTAQIGVAQVDYLRLAGGATSVSNVLNFSGSNLNNSLIGQVTISAPADGHIFVTGYFEFVAPLPFFSATARANFSARVRVEIQKNGVSIGSKDFSGGYVNGPWVGYMLAFGSSVGAPSASIGWGIPITATIGDVFTILLIGNTFTSFPAGGATNTGTLQNGTIHVSALYR